MLSAYLSGLFLGFSLIIAIGAQNAFVLRQGLKGEHILAVCLTCFLSDALLIWAGVEGFAQASGWLPWLEGATRYAGAAFLLAYGLRSFRTAWRSKDALSPSEAAPAGLKAVLALCLALTWLNPHVYLDTVVLLGSISVQFTEGKAAFALGAMSASALFFFALGYGARLLRPVFAKPAAWRALDAVIGATMCGIAASLVV